MRLLQKMILRYLHFKGQNEPLQYSEPISGAGNLQQWLRSSGNTNRTTASDSLRSRFQTQYATKNCSWPATPPSTSPKTRTQVAQGSASHPVLHIYIWNQSPRQGEELSQVIATFYKNLGVKRNQTWAFSKACKSKLLVNHILYVQCVKCKCLICVCLPVLGHSAGLL